jgi:ABC-type transport system substrate-binding protein
MRPASKYASPRCATKIGDSNDLQSLDKARKVRLALNLAVNKNAIIESLWKGTGSATPFMHWYYPFNKGYSQDWKIPPYDLKRAKELLSEAGAASRLRDRGEPDGLYLCARRS